MWYSGTEAKLELVYICTVSQVTFLIIFIEDPYFSVKNEEVKVENPEIWN